MDLTSRKRLTNNLYKDIIISNQNNESLKKTLRECVEILKLFKLNHSYALNRDDFKRPMLTDTLHKATTFLQKNVTTNEKLEKVMTEEYDDELDDDDLDDDDLDDDDLDDDDIDITKYRTITIGDDEDDHQRYGCLKTANMDSKFKIYKVANYVGPKNFKIVSSKPIGTYDPENDELTLNEE